MTAPPSMKSPVIISLGPGFKIGSPGGGPGFTELWQSGFTDTEISLATSPGRTLCVRIVWMVGTCTRAPVKRSEQPAALALVRATDTVSPVTRGTRHERRAEAAATLEVAVSDNGRRMSANSVANHHRSVRVMIPP